MFAAESQKDLPFCKHPIFESKRFEFSDLHGGLAGKILQTKAVNRKSYKFYAYGLAIDRRETRRKRA
jgi:hypothetical protein